MPKPRYKRGRNPGKRGNLGRKKVKKSDVRKAASDIDAKDDDVVTSSTSGYEMDSSRNRYSTPQ